MIKISCPYCDFSRDILPDRIPEKAGWANCPKCGNRFEINMPEIHAGDIKADNETAGESGFAQPVPRTQRPDQGLWQWIVQNFRQVLFSPHTLFSTMTRTRGSGEDLAFGLLFGSIGAMVGLFWQFLIMPNRFIQAGKFIFGDFNLSAIFLALIIAAPLFVVFQLYSIALILHIGLIIFRGDKKGFAGTFRVISYSQATRVLNLIPFIGGFIGFFWRLIIQIIGLKEVHETSYMRIILAYLLPLVLVLFFVFLVIVLFLSFL